MPDYGSGTSVSANRLIAAATTNATLVKAAPGFVAGYQLYNAAAYAVFLKLYNSATIPTAGSGTPVLTVGVPAGGTVNVDLTLGFPFSSGIGYTVTKLSADNDTTALVAGDLIVNLLYG